MVAHHQGDLAETTLKRFLEGAPFFKLSSMQDVAQMYGIPIWRPFLSLSRQEIEKRILSAPILPLQDPTNRDPRFLRSRLRHEVLPYLTEKCGKQVQPGIVAVAEEAKELADYFREQAAPFLSKVLCGPLGWWADWRGGVPVRELEIRYLLRFFLEQAGVSLSREIVERATKGLLQQEAGLSFPFSGGSLWVDRKQLFLLKPPTQPSPHPTIFSWPSNTPPAWGGFFVKSAEQTKQSVWEGELSVALEPGEYHLAAPDAHALCCFAKTTLRDWWAKHRVPLCLRQLVPVVWKEGRVVREFLVQDFSLTSLGYTHFR